MPIRRSGVARPLTRPDDVGILTRVTLMLLGVIIGLVLPMLGAPAWLAYIGGPVTLLTLYFLVMRLIDDSAAASRTPSAGELDALLARAYDTTNPGYAARLRDPGAHRMPWL